MCDEMRKGGNRATRTRTHRHTDTDTDTDTHTHTHTHQLAGSSRRMVGIAVLHTSSIARSTSAGSSTPRSSSQPSRLKCATSSADSIHASLSEFVISAATKSAQPLQEAGSATRREGSTAPGNARLFPPGRHKRQFTIPGEEAPLPGIA